MSVPVNAVALSAARPHRSVLVRVSVYLLVLALCVPTDLFPVLFPGHRQLLVPVATALCGLAWLVFMRGRFTSVRGNMSLIWPSLVIFLGVAVLASVTNVNAAGSLLLVVTYAVRFLMLFVLVQILAEDDWLLVRAQRLLVVGLAIVALLMVTGILDLLGGYLRVSDAGSSTILRASAGLGDPNFTALAFNVGVAFALTWFATASSRMMRSTAVIAVFILVLGIGRTVSIGGLVGLVVVLFLSWWRMVRPAGRRRFGLMLLTAGVLVVIATAAGGVYLARIKQQVTSAQHSIGALGTERLNLSIGGLRMAVAHPILGVGPNNVAESMPPYLLFPISEPEQGAHDGFISIMDETGIPSFLLLCFVGALILNISIRCQRHLRKELDRYRFLVGEGIGIALVATLVQTLALDTQRYPILWLVFALALALGRKVLEPQTKSHLVVKAA